MARIAASVIPLTGRIARNRQSLPNEELALLTSALAHPARITILKILLKGDRVFGDLVSELPLAQSTISQHVAVLKSAGLIDGYPQGKQCICYAVREQVNRLKSLIAKL